MAVEAPLVRLRPDDISWTESDGGEIVVLDLRTSRYLSVNSSGAALWRPLVDGISESDLARLLVDTFAISAEQAHDDVDRFVALLRQRDLLATAG
jgi:hypothetical protein